MVRKPILEKREGLGKGKGPAEVYNIETKEELFGHGRMYAKVVLPVGSYIGWHQHVGETESYYILKGEGIFTDNDGTKTHVFPDDVCTILPGHFHALDNASDTEPVELMALIHND